MIKHQITRTYPSPPSKASSPGTTLNTTAAPAPAPVQPASCWMRLPTPLVNASAPDTQAVDSVSTYLSSPVVSKVSVEQMGRVLSIQPIVDLLRADVINANNAHPLAFLKDPQARRSFVNLLHLEMALLEPFARSVKRLESSASTPADVCLFWPASQATLLHYFTDKDARSEFMTTKDTVSENINPLATTLTLPSRLSTSPSTRSAPDSDLRRSIPTYEVVGGYLGELPRHEIKSGRLPDYITSPYPTKATIFQEFRAEFEAFVWQRSPFDRYLQSKSAFEYWTSLSRHFDAFVLSYLAIKQYSVIPNWMAEERTVSNFTKLNSSDRGRQKASTIVYMTQIKYHKQRRLKNASSSYVEPTIRFRDLSNLLKQAGEPAIKLSGEGLNASATKSTEEAPDTWEEDAGFDEEIKVPKRGSGGGFEVAGANGVNLQDAILRDLLSDQPVVCVAEQGTVTRPQLKSSVPTSGPQSQSDNALLETPYNF
ncbi:hypothetical protein FRC10_002557 [Ceratobasidium sp. 414]|nr:hypothetical protein FRC10_002557 [Ceratobasidium sp. 414]